MRNALIVASLFFFSCAGYVRDQLSKQLDAKGQLIREWREGTEELRLNREGNRVVQYRLITSSTPTSVAAQAEVMYAIDTVAHTCYTGPIGTTPMECKSLAKVASMNPYVVTGVSSNP